MAAIITGTSGNNDLINTISGAIVNALSGNDTVTNTANDVTISGGDGDDYIENGYYGIASNVLIDGDDGNDTIWNGEVNSSINGGNGDDSIYSYGDSVTVNGDAGNDYIWNDGGKDVTIDAGDGDDTIWGFKADSTLSIDGSYSTQTSGNNVLVYVGNGTITVKDAASLESVNIIGTKRDTYIYTGGNETISNYTGEKIIVGMLPTGLNFIGNNFHFYSKKANGVEDELVVQDVMDKVIDFRDGNGGEFAKAYAITNPGIIDGRASLGVEYLDGSSAGNNTIYAGNGDSRLWGNTGNGSDILVGGAGFDIFFVGKNDGNDIILNASATDDIHLYDATLSDIVSTSESNGTLALLLNTGNTVIIQCNDTLSSTLNFSGGSRYQFNCSTKSWQSA